MRMCGALREASGSEWRFSIAFMVRRTGKQQDERQMGRFGSSGQWFAGMDELVSASLEFPISRCGPNTPMGW
jgi:hypothetical protein